MSSFKRRVVKLIPFIRVSLLVMAATALTLTIAWAMLNYSLSPFQFVFIVLFPLIFMVVIPLVAIFMFLPKTDGVAR